MHRGTRGSAAAMPASNLDRLHGLQGHHCGRQQSIQTLIPLRRKFQAPAAHCGRPLQTLRPPNLRSSELCRLLPSCFVLHRRSAQLSSTSSCLYGAAILFPRDFGSLDRAPPTAITWLRTSMPNSRRKQFGQALQWRLVPRTPGPRRVRARSELPESCISVRRPDPHARAAGEATRLCFAASPVFDGKRLLPVFPILIFQQNGDRRANRLSVADSGKNVRRIALDLHASAAAITLLSAP